MTRVATERKQKTEKQNLGNKKIPNPYNIGFLDRSLRFIIGGAMLGSVVYLSPSIVVSLLGNEIMLMKVLALLSLYPLLTAWIGRDPIYHLLSINSATRLKEDKCGDIVDQVKTAIHLDS